MVAHEFERVAPLDQAEALGGQALELDRLDLGAVLLELRCLMPPSSKNGSAPSNGCLVGKISSAACCSGSSA
jgi:hypothetical protein